MGQVTIYLEDDVEKKMALAAKSVHLSKSKWVSHLIREKVANEWPKSVSGLAGAWEDMPTLEDIRSGMSNDAARENI